MAGIYIHVPFCQSRCAYCDFYSTTLSEEWKSQYLSALQREMQARRYEVGDKEIDTLYLGGGTPSQLPPTLLERLFGMVTGLFSLKENAEVTVEANPDDVTPQWLESLHRTPTNRISMGVQTFDDNLLALLRRRHTAIQAFEAVEACKTAGYENLSLDLIYGLPGQSIGMWRKDLAQIAKMDVPHLSAYALQYEPGTELYRMRQNGNVEEADEELSLEMYQELCSAAFAMGMEHYEISNFSHPGKRSRHNSGYWSQEPYWGFGPGAHSYDGARCRRWNNAQLKAYIEAEGDVPHGSETLSDEECYDELVMTRLRTIDGLPLSLLSQENRIYCLRMAERHLNSGKMTLKDDVLRIEESGIFVSDDILSDLMR